MAEPFGKSRYPATPRLPVTEVVHGRTITDPYRWLEDGESQRVEDWTGRQNALAREVLDGLPQRAPLRRALARAFAHSTAYSPELRGDTLFYMHRSSDRDQPVLRARRFGGHPAEAGLDVTGGGPDAQDRVILDPNEADPGGFVSLDWWTPSADGSLLAYGYSSNGNEWATLRLLDVRTGRRLDDEIPHMRMNDPAWKPDASGFYYTRYPAPGEVPPGEENYHHHVRYHTLGTDPEDDPLVFAPGQPLHQLCQVDIDDQGRYLLIRVFDLGGTDELYVRDETRPQLGFQQVLRGHHAQLDGIVHGGTLYLLTNLGAPNFRLIAADLVRVFGGSGRCDLTPETPESLWPTLVPEGDRVLREFTLVGGRIIVHAIVDAISQVLVFGLDGQPQGAIQLPGPGSVWSVVGDPGRSAGLLTYASFTSPPSIYAFDLEPPGSARPDCARPAELPLTPLIAGESAVRQDDYQVRQVFYQSRDGTRVPMFIVHRDGLPRDRAHPTVLTGYGGFNIARTPQFSPPIFPWLDAGGVYALACLRGGCEYGEAWHQAGMLGNKQNVFDDFIAAGEYLIQEGYADPARLGIFGRSNGGLLVGAAMTQRPEMFGAVVCGVPLLDMLRYHRFLIAALWVPEYGSAKDPEQFEWLHAYSPYHRVREGECYPATFLFTAGGDSRVDPMHARKMAALLQASNGSGNPTLLEVETRAGHGAGKPVSRVVEAEADMWAFLAWRLGLDTG